jgi:hypothetical protein
MPGAGFTEPPYGKASSERPALKPYWGKPAVRNFRGDDGNVGIMRSPVRAIVLPGKSPSTALARGRVRVTTRPTLQRYFCPGVYESAPPEPPLRGRFFIRH